MFLPWLGGGGNESYRNKKEGQCIEEQKQPCFSSWSLPLHHVVLAATILLLWYDPIQPDGLAFHDQEKIYWGRNSNFPIHGKTNWINTAGLMSVGIWIICLHPNLCAEQTDRQNKALALVPSLSRVIHMSHAISVYIIRKCKIMRNEVVD